MGPTEHGRRSIRSSATSEGAGVLSVLTSHHAFRTSRAPSPYTPLPAPPPEHLRLQGRPTRPMRRPDLLPALLTLFAQWPWCKDFGLGSRWLHQAKDAPAGSKSRSELPSLCSTQRHNGALRPTVTTMGRETCVRGIL